MPPPDIPMLALDAAGRDDEDVIREAVLALYDVRRDDAELRKIGDDPGRGERFSALRRDYWKRRAFHNTRIQLTGGPPELRAKLAALGFKA